MTTLEPEKELAAASVEVSETELTVRLENGRSLTVPLAWYPRLAHGTAQERSNWTLIAGGLAIEWPDLDEHIGTEGLLAGRRSGESERSLRRWLYQRQRRG